MEKMDYQLNYEECLMKIENKKNTLYQLLKAYKQERARLKVEYPNEHVLGMLPYYKRDIKLWIKAIRYYQNLTKKLLVSGNNYNQNI